MDLWKYSRAVLLNTKTYLTGGGPIAVVYAADHLFHVPVPRWFEIVVAILAVLLAPYAAWREQHQARVAAEARVVRLETPAGVLAPKISDDEYWFLRIVRRYGLRLGSRKNRNGPGAQNSFFLKNTPIDHAGSILFWHLVGTSTECGLIRPQSGIYTLTPEGMAAVEARTLAGEVPVQREPLVNALTGLEEKFPLE
jgi:hypothetical protein